MSQFNRPNLITDIVSNIYNNIVNFISGQRMQDRLKNIVDSTPNILTDADQANGYVATNSDNEMESGYYNQSVTYATILAAAGIGKLWPNKFYQIVNAVGGARLIQVCAENSFQLVPTAYDLNTGEMGTYDLATDVFTAVPKISINTTITGLQALITANDILAGVRYNVADATPQPCSVWGVSAGVVTTYAEIGGIFDGSIAFKVGFAGLYNPFSGTFTEQGRIATAPTVDEDSIHGYYLGQRLTTLDTGVEYECTDDSTGAAVWVAVAVGGVAITPINYADLVIAIGASGLTTLGWYLINDFQLTHTIPNTSDTHTAAVEPILIQAIAPNKLADFGYSQTWLDEIVYYSVENNQDAVLGCTMGYVKRRVNTKWNIDFGTDYRNNIYRRWALNVTNVYDDLVTYAKYDVVQDGSGAIYGSLVDSNLGAGLSDGYSWITLGFNNGEYFSLNDSVFINNSFVIPADAADFEDYPMLDPDDLDNGYYFNGFIEQSSDYANIFNGSNQLFNAVVNGGSSLYNFAMNGGSSINNFTMNSGSSINNFAMSGNGSSLNNFTMNGGSNIYNFTMSNGSSLNNFTMNGGSNIYNFTMSSGSVLSNLTMNSGSIYNFTMSSGSVLSNLTMNSGSIQNFAMSGGSYFSDFMMIGSSIYNFTMSSATITTFDPSVATIMFLPMSKTITSRQDGTTRLSYINDLDVLIITDINA